MFDAAPPSDLADDSVPFSLLDVRAGNPSDNNLPQATEEVVADKSYHSSDALEDLAVLQLSSYISEPDRGRQQRRDKAEAQAAEYGNRPRPSPSRS